MKCDHKKYWDQFKEMMEILQRHNPLQYGVPTFEKYTTWLKDGRPVLAKRLKVKYE